MSRGKGGREGKVELEEERGRGKERWRKQINFIYYVLMYLL